MAAYEEEDDDGYFVIAAAYDDDDGFAIASASEEEDGDYIKVNTTFVPPPLPLPLPSSSSSSHASTESIPSSSPAPYDVDVEEQISPSPSPAETHCVDVVHDAAAALWQQDAVAVDDAPAAQLYPTPVFSPSRRPQFECEFVARRPQFEYGFVVGRPQFECEFFDEAADEEEEEDDDDDDYMYRGRYYDLADRGRARHVKRSSGRRGRTKKASTMGRPRGDVRLPHCSGDL